VAVQIVFDLAAIAGVSWFWVRMARPALAAQHAASLAVQLGLATTLFLIVTLLVHLAAMATLTAEVPATWLRLLGGFFWIVIVGLGYPRYGFLRQLTERRPPGA
jgi:hypothetical protein